MVYLDNAATTFPKPESVYVAMDKMNREGAVNAGRGSYKLAQAASKMISDTKTKLRQLVRVDASAAVVFSPSITIAISSALRDMGYDDKEYTDEQLKVLARNKERNLAIMSQLRQLYLDKKPTIVFACSVDHAKMLAAMLTLEGIPNSLVLGDMEPMDRKHAIDLFKNRKSGVDIIINYEVLTTGFDSKNIKCVFITRPTKSIVLYSQMLGRGLRGPMMGGNEECDLIDIDDNLQAFDNETAFSHFNDYWRI